MNVSCLSLTIYAAIVVVAIHYTYIYFPIKKKKSLLIYWNKRLPWWAGSNDFTARRFPTPVVEVSKTEMFDERHFVRQLRGS